VAVVITRVGRRDPEVIVVLVRGGGEVARWRLAASGRPKLTVVDELARTRLGARRLGCSIEVRNLDVELRELIDLFGLREILGVAAPLCVEVVGEAEGREQIGVEKVVMTDDPVA
jgi:pyrrolidone-carboxylate peptidase